MAEGLKILAQAHRSLVWERTRATNRLRSSLREYFPAALDTFSELAERDSLAVLATAPTLSEVAKLTPAKIRTVLGRAGRQRNINTRADTIAAGLRSDALRAPAAVEAAHGATTRASVAILVELNAQIEALASELADHLEQHPDSDIYLSLPGVGVVLGARALGEFGDDPNRYADTKSHSITRRSARSPPAPVPVRSVTNDTPLATRTTKPAARSGTVGSASCAAASPSKPLRREHCLGPQNRHRPQENRTSCLTPTASGVSGADRRPDHDIPNYAIQKLSVKNRP